jgi:transcription-repair coupling factor (superfamily II helicase)
MEDESEIEPFQIKLQDRFGKIPPEAEELLRIVPLRRLARKIGIERVSLKVGRMTLHLVVNPDSPYYQSEAFDKLLRYIQKNYLHTQLKETNKRRSVVIQHVTTVERGIRILEEINTI